MFNLSAAIILIGIALLSLIISVNFRVGYAAVREAR